MELVDFVRAVNPSEVKANYMHGKLHDVVVMFGYRVNCAQLDVLRFVENATSRWPFCSYTITPVKGGVWQVKVEYRVRRDEMARFCEIFSLQKEMSVI